MLKFKRRGQYVHAFIRFMSPNPRFELHLFENVTIHVVLKNCSSSVRQNCSLYAAEDSTGIYSSLKVWKYMLTQRHFRLTIAAIETQQLLPFELLLTYM
jgi:hypothetical protein